MDVDKEDTNDVVEIEKASKIPVKLSFGENNFDQILELQTQITTLLKMLTLDVTLIPDVSQLQEFREIQIVQNYLVSNCYRNYAK